MRKPKKTEIYINSGTRNWHFTPTVFHRNATWKAVFALRGTFAVDAKKGKYVVPESSAILIPGLVPHRFMADQPVRILVVIAELPAKLLPAALMRSKKPKILHPRSRDVELLQCLHAFCRELWLLDNHSSSALLKQLMECWMTILLRAPERRRRVDQKEKSLRKAHLYIAECFNMPIRIQQLARKMGMSETNFRRLYHEAYGIAPKQDILQRRIGKAKDLLSETDLGVTEIADQCGFSDEQEFSRYFRKKLGVPPGAWRRSTTCEAQASR